MKTPCFRNVLVTGATSGIGEAVVLELAKCGTAVIHFCGRNAERLADVAKRVEALGAKAVPVQLDVADEAATAAWISRVDAETPLDLVYANAGMASDGKEDNPDVTRRVFAVNVGGVLNTVLPALQCYRAVPDGRLAKRIAITSSMTGYHGMPQCPAYSASKCAVKAWGFALRGRVRREGIIVSTVCPGFVRSRITDQNTCPMPFFWEADRAARRIVDAIARGTSLITFPWPMRLAMYWISTLPAILSERLFRLLPEKV